MNQSIAKTRSRRSTKPIKRFTPNLTVKEEERGDDEWGSDVEEINERMEASNNEYDNQENPEENEYEKEWLDDDSIKDLSHTDTEGEDEGGGGEEMYTDDDSTDIEDLLDSDSEDDTDDSSTDDNDSEFD